MKNKIKKILQSIEIVCVYLKNKIFRKRVNKKNNEVNILFIIGKIANGGAERICVNIAEELNKKYNVTIAIFQKTQNEYKCNVPIIALDSSKKSLSNRVAEISKIKKEKSITHSFSFLIAPNYINALTKINDKTIISVRNYMSDSHKDNKKDIKLHKIACLLANKIVSVSKNVEIDQIQNWKINKRKSLTIPNFVDEQKIIESIAKGKIDPEDEKIFEGSKVVINVGRLVTQKGQENLIRAFKYVIEKVPNAKLIILGEGELKDNLNNLIKDLKLSNNIFILGFKNNPYIYMKKSHLFISNSHYEGMSNVILEAMKCELPIIATESNGGNREILIENQEKYGVLVPIAKETETEKIIANEMINILTNEELRQQYISKSKERINKYSKEKIIKQWEALIWN